MKIQVLPAENGDCILVEHAPKHYFLIDGGYVDTVNKYLGPKLDGIKAEGGVIDVIVVTHIDKDHISGIIKLMEAPLQVTVGEIWYNGYRHIQSNVPVKEGKDGFWHQEITKEVHPSHNSTFGGRQGCTLSALIRKRGVPWNVPAEGGVMKAPMSFQVGETKVHLLSPTEKKLKSLEKYWRHDLEKNHLLDEAHSQEYWDDAFEWAIAGEEDKREGFLEHVDGMPDSVKKMAKKAALPKNRVEEALEEVYKADGSAANGSSISFVLETPDGARALLLGDAHAETVIDSLKTLYGDTGEKIHFDVVKLAHHGSFNNTSPALLDLIDSDKWIVSTNGEVFHHPEMATLAHIVTRGKDNKLYFNYEMDICQELRKDEYKPYGFEVLTPEGQDGITVTVGEALAPDPLTGKPDFITEAVLDCLTQKAKESPRLRMNLDLRNSPEDLSQRMLNAVEPGTVLPIHRHRTTSETVVCLRGSFTEIFYDDNGHQQKVFHLTPSQLLNIPQGQWHTLISNESGTVLLECKDGPYEPLGEEDILKK